MALGLIVGGAVVFVERGGRARRRPWASHPSILALVIAPIATELPEKFNSVIWIRAGKDTLAMGNITGAMVFQSCIPTVIGLVFASERVAHRHRRPPESLLAFASAGIAFLATAGHLPADVAHRTACAAAGCCWAACFYAGVPRARRR